MRACEGVFENLMKLLDFRLGKMYIRHFDMLMSYERIMPGKAERLRQESKMSKTVETADDSRESRTKSKMVGGTINGDRGKQAFNKAYLHTNQRRPTFTLCTGNREVKLGH